jgi:hypothetical protein
VKKTIGAATLAKHLLWKFFKTFAKKRGFWTGFPRNRVPWQLKVSFEKEKRAIKLAINYSVVLRKIIFLVSKSEFQTNFFNFCWRSTAVWRSAVAAILNLANPVHKPSFFGE